MPPARPAPPRLALAAALLLAAACNSYKGDCIDGLEGQIRCRTPDAAIPSATEICLDGDWQTLQACDTTAGQTCTDCVALDAEVPHLCTPCAAPNAEAQCALAAPVLACPTP